MERNLFTKVRNERNNISYCINQNDLLRNCSYAINLTKNGIEKYDCLECIDDNKLIYNYEADIHYCQYVKETKRCMVKYCKTCRNGNNYFCSECILSNYEVNSLTGKCVEKSEQIPDIIFKDIFRLILNGQYQRNGQIFYGPSLMLRGITNSQINTRHAFLIYLTFKVKSSLRILENNDDIIIPSICEVKNSVKESLDDINIVDYECISNNSNNTNLDKYELDIIEEGENEGLLKKSNIKELSQNINKENLIKEDSLFEYEDLMNYVIFEMDNIQNQTAKDFIFNFKIEGKLTKEINKGNVSIELELNEIEDKANCNFTIEDYKKGYLNCLIDMNKYKDKCLFTFKTSELNFENHVIYLSKLSEIYLINYIENSTPEEKEYNISNINTDELNIYESNNDNNIHTTDSDNYDKNDNNSNAHPQNEEERNNLKSDNNNDDEENSDNVKNDNKGDDNQNKDKNNYDNNNKKNNIAIIVGCSIAGVILISGCIALIIYLLKRRKKPSYFDPTKNEKKIVDSNNNKVIVMENDCKSNDPVFK